MAASLEPEAFSKQVEMFLYPKRVQAETAHDLLQAVGFHLEPLAVDPTYEALKPYSAGWVATHSHSERMEQGFREALRHLFSPLETPEEIKPAETGIEEVNELWFLASALPESTLIIIFGPPEDVRSGVDAIRFSSFSRRAHYMM